MVTMPCAEAHCHGRVPCDSDEFEVASFVKSGRLCLGTRSPGAYGVRRSHPEERPTLSTSIRHLRVFESVAVLQSMHRASVANGVTQPAVTQAIAKLEQEVGVLLFDRRINGCYVNEFGALLLRRVQRMFAQIEKALGELDISGKAVSIKDIASAITRPQIRTLVAIAENGSFNSAARALEMSASVVQKDARELEEVLRTPLYCQTASGSGTTPAAATLARRLSVALREIELAVEEIAAARGDTSGDIVIGAMPLTGSIVMRSVISDLVHQYPYANIRMMSDNTEAMLHRLCSGEVDFVVGLFSQPMPRELVCKKLAESRYLVVARAGHPLSRKRNVTLDDLAKYEWIIGSPGAHRRIYFEKLFPGRRRPVARISTDSLPTITTLLMHSDCLTLLTPYECTESNFALTSVGYEPVGCVPCVGLTMRKSWLPTTLHAGVMELIGKRVVESH